MSYAIPFFSAFLQLAAAALALRLARLARGTWGWLLLALASGAMALRCALAGWELLATHRPLPMSEWGSLLVSVLMLLGMAGLGGLLRTAHRAELDFQGTDREREAQAREPLRRDEASRQAGASGHLLEAMIDSIDIWISALDQEGRIVLWNRAAERITGYSREEVMGRSDFWEWLYPDSGVRAMLAFDMESLMRKGEQVRGQTMTLLRKDGTSRTLTWYIAPVVLPQGESLGYFAIAHDVTGSLPGAGDLQRVRTFQDLILDNSALGLGLVRHRAYRWLNPKASEILGLSRHGAEGVPTHVNFADEKHYREFMERAYPLLAKGGYADLRIRLKRANGPLFWCRLVGKALDPAHIEEGAVWMIEDITERMAVESSLAESEARFRGAFEGTLDALVLMTPKGIFDCNRQTLQIFGFDDKSEILQRGLDDLSPASQGGGKSSAELMGRHLQGVLVGERVRFYWTFRRRGVGDFLAEVNMNTLLMGRRKVILACIRPSQPAVTGVRDLDWEVGIRVFLDRNPMATMIIDTQAHRFVYCNRAALAILRCRLDEVYGMGPEELSPPFQPDGRSSREFSNEMNAIALQGGSHRFRHIHRSPHRGDFTVDVTLTALQPGHSPLLVVNWAEVSE